MIVEIFQLVHYQMFEEYHHTQYKVLQRRSLTRHFFYLFFSNSNPLARVLEESISSQYLSFAAS